MRRALGLIALVGCTDPMGFGGGVPALATVTVEATGDLASVQLPRTGAPALRVALVWAAQWLTEPLCILPPDDATGAALIAAGCRDPLGFVPARVAGNAALGADGRAELALVALPGADVMIGDVTARVAYGSLVIYDDVDGDGTLTLGRTTRLAGREMDGGDEEQPGGQSDPVYAASFVTMTEPDTRLAFREGGFVQTGFYPRSGCGEPPPSFSLISAGGFTVEAAIAAQQQGQLPPEDPATCRQVSTEAPVALAYRAPAELREVACEERRTDSSIRYREPPADSPSFAGRTVACMKVPDFGSGAAHGALQLAVSSRTDDACVGLTHYVLRGCREDALCALPDWDITATPPSWWPCALQATP